MKNILFEQNEIKLWNKQHFVENKTDYSGCLKNAVSTVHLLYCVGVSDLTSSLSWNVAETDNRCSANH